MSLTPSQLAAQAPPPTPAPLQPAAAARTKRCPSCGLSCPGDAFFCSQCGADVSLERSELRQDVAHAAPTPAAAAAPVPAPAAVAFPQPVAGQGSARNTASLPKLAPPLSPTPQPPPAPSQPPRKLPPPVPPHLSGAVPAAAAAPSPGPGPAAAPAPAQGGVGTLVCPQCAFANPGFAILCMSCGADLAKAAPAGSLSGVIAHSASAATGAPPAPPVRDRTTPAPPPVPGSSARIKSAAAALHAPAPRLELVIGNKSFECHDGDVLGRAGTLASDLFAPFGTVSRQHASIVLQGNRWFVVPSPSVHNATRLDGVELRRGEPTALTGEHVLGMSSKCEVKLRVVHAPIEA
ncbi:hypothetical protein DB346_16625 [Verrucomicrobia bacterium LW23]|nr:hypothetical protein DB346_16625 [Verrucomicrobia bacterium LW23]